MKTLPLSSDRDSLFKSMARAVPLPTAKNRNRLWNEDSFFGRMRGDNIRIYFRPRHRFAFFSCVLYGRIRFLDGKTVLQCRFARPLAMRLIFSLWLAILAATAVILRTELFFPLVCGALFLIGILPLVCILPSEKRRLTDRIASLDGKSASD